MPFNTQNIKKDASLNPIPQDWDDVQDDYHPKASPFDIRNGGVEASLSVGTTAIEIKAGASPLANRRVVFVHVMGDSPVYWGFSSTLTTGEGSPLLPGQTYPFKFDPTNPVSIYAVADVAQDVRVTETN